MEGNKEEARKAMDIAETKLSKNDYVEAKKFVNKAQNLYPNLDGLEQVSLVIDVLISASNVGGGGESDWYGILGVDPLADDETLKTQYKKLALLIHPDKIKFNGAEEAFKLVLNAWCLLSDKDKRIAYDQKRNSKQVKQEKSGTQEKPPNPRSNNKLNPEYEYYAYEPKRKPKRKHKRKHEPTPDPSWNQKKDNTFWTECNRCKTHCKFLRANYLNKTMPCPNCNQDFVATEIIPEMINGRPVIRIAYTQHHQEEESSANSQSTSKNTSDQNTSTSASFDRLFKKLMNANSTFEAERLFKEAMTDMK